MPITALLALSALVAPAPPAAAAPPRDQSRCINQDPTTSWAPVDDHTLLVTSGLRRFRVTTSTCPALTRGLPQVHVVLPGGGYICGPHDAHLYVSTAGGVGPIPCFIRDIAPLADANARAPARR